MAGGATDTFHFRCASQDLSHNLVGMLREDGCCWRMARETATTLVASRVGLEPNTQYRTEDRRLQRCPMQQRSIHPAKSFEVRRLLARSFPFFIVSIMTLLTIFRPNKDCLNFLHPVTRSLNRCLLPSDLAEGQADGCHDKHEGQASDSWCRPSVS